MKRMTVCITKSLLPIGRMNYTFGMSIRNLLCVAILAGAWQSSPVRACIWDNDTLAAEQARFPEIAQLITGMFPRHSREFHAWRLLTAEEQIAQGKGGLIAYDDLAVSQHKLGDHRAAIETMLKKDQVSPGLYETYSNLGTFYIYTGELETAASYIRKALAINADAHFGREKYQLWIVEWLQLREKTPPPNEPDQGSAELALGVPHGFADFLARRLNKTGNNSQANLELPLKQRAEALRGILGMMWFADFDNPLLLEALGDLLIVGDIKTNAAQLAALSYLHASRVAATDAEKARLRKLFEAAGVLTPDFKPDAFEKRLDAGLAKGRDYFETIRNDEITWIKAGLDAGYEFQKKYLKP